MLKQKFMVFVLVLLTMLKVQSQSEFIGTTGDILQLAIPAAALATEVIEKDKRGIYQFAAAFSVNFLVTHGVKRIVNKTRPDGGPHAFPSGHTSTAFQGASFIQIRHGWKYGIPSYLLASFVGYSRVDAKRHDYIDVAAGAVLGTLTSYIFAKPKLKHISPDLRIESETHSYMLGLKFSI